MSPWNTPLAACHGKQGFDTWNAANRVVVAMRRHRTAHGKVRPYRCPFCPKWHVGQARSGL